MKTMIRTQVIFAVGLLALPFTAQLAQAQSCAPGMGMTTANLLSGVYGRPAAVNLTSYSLGAGTAATNFVSPTRIQPTSANHAYVLDNGLLLSLNFNPANGASLEGLQVSSTSMPISALVAMASASGHLWVASSNQFGAADNAILTPALSLPDSGVGSMIFDGSYLWISHPTGAHTGTLTKVSLNLSPNGIAAPTFTQVAVPNAVGLNHMTFDGQYLWAAGTALSGGAQTLFKFNPSTGTAVDYASTADAPQALTFDGYSIWVADLINVTRIEAATGAHTGTYTASDARSLSFDGVQMWVAERSANTIVPIRACDGASAMSSLTTPAYPENVAFDGTNLWVTSPTSKTISIR